MKDTSNHDLGLPGYYLPPEEALRKPRRTKPPSMGPAPTLLSRSEVDALYEVLGDILQAFQVLQIRYIITGGSLLGAVRQQSILFCDDDVDVAVLEEDLPKARQHLKQHLSHSFYQVEPWEAGDRVRHTRYHNAFVDIFGLRRYDHGLDDVRHVLEVKANGNPQPDEYVESILETMRRALRDRGNVPGNATTVNDTQRRNDMPLYHFSSRKAIELWSKEVYRENELFPLRYDYRMGPLEGISGPRKPILLLERAFGHDCFQCYYQSHSHQQSQSTSQSITHSVGTSSASDLPPHVLGGGTWEDGRRRPLSRDLYTPLQPTSKALRRPTTHNYLQLMQRVVSESLAERPKRTVYLDGVFDLLHWGHVEAIQQCVQLGNRVIVGVTGDDDATGYKRRPILRQAERVALLEALAGVDYVISPCPLVVTEAFMNEYDIDLVVHGFANDEDARRQEEFFDAPMRLGKFLRIRYSDKQSTTDIIQSIVERESNRHYCLKNGANNGGWSKWFGRDVVAWSNGAPSIPCDPVPLALRQTMEQHLEKARIQRRDALSLFDSNLLQSFEQSFGRQGNIDVDEATMTYLRHSFLACTGLDQSIDLCRLHETEGAKDSLMEHMVQNFADFQADYDSVVRHICLPHLERLKPGTDSFYYQSFPCLRVVQPGEFSIGPHADIAYGHHPCTINVYVSLTPIVSGNTASLFLEDRRGSEDWHPLLEGDCLGAMKHFAGATVLHWTTENMTEDTRVTLDFRIIPGCFYEKISTEDVYRSKAGYYCHAVKTADGWRHDDADTPLPTPDSRFGYPWTRYVK